MACFSVFACVFAITFAIDHFASIWENAEPSSWHGRFSAWATDNHKLDVVQGVSGLASALACLVCVIAGYYALTFVDVAGERRFALYVTGGPEAAEGEALRQFYVTKGDLEKIPMFEYVDSHRIVKGNVSSVLPIGGGLAHICVANDTYCGLTDSSLGLKSGDVAYIRIGRPSAGQRRPPGWTITADEANALAANARFTVENK
jgi:hypothetical protein